ncbi:MAG: HypC/HybG/HupF family hydrogenase formation chaperone [Gemmatimonadales bacterium]|nr:HypC/HybG/HupF family hydrogenase formation chaperone [Gemmatimonadales bacterium]
MTHAGQAAACAAGESCITCSDQGVVLHVLHVMADGIGRCADEGGRVEEIDLTLIDGVAEGDIVLAHAGVALVRIRREQVRS